MWTPFVTDTVFEGREMGKIEFKGNSVNLSECYSISPSGFCDDTFCPKQRNRSAFLEGPTKK